MSDFNVLRSPLNFLRSRLQNIPHRDVLQAEEVWWKNKGLAISDAIDREAMILAIWEGTSHRQILDGLEVMERKHAHKLLFLRLAQFAPSKELHDMESEADQHLKLPHEQREALAEPLFRKLAVFTAETLTHK